MYMAYLVKAKNLTRYFFCRLLYCMRCFEGWHTQSTTPGYIGYGHQIQTGEVFHVELTKKNRQKLYF